ncbi:MAG: hypothetical protein AAGA87_17110, partial [Pseudomonadota bacterium]
MDMNQVNGIKSANRVKKLLLVQVMQRAARWGGSPMPCKARLEAFATHGCQTAKTSNQHPCRGR